MPSIRRYGPALVTPQVSPRPELGRGRQKQFEVFQDIFDTANEFIRPAVIQNRTAVGEQEALAAVEEKGPEWGLETVEGEGTDVQLGGKPATGVKPTKKAGAILKGLTDRGMPKHIAMGFLINAQDESSFNPAAIGDGGSSGGLFQWHGDRFKALKAYAQSQGKPWQDQDVQLDFLVNEELPGSQAGAWAKIQQAEDVPSAAVAVLNHFEIPAERYRTAREAKYLGGASVNVPGDVEYDLKTLNSSTFEPRLPFTVRDAAFNKAADRVISARASAALEEGMRAAQSKADGDIGVLRDELEKVRAQVMSELPTDLPGLASDVQASFDRGKLVAERQAAQLAQKRVIQRQDAAIGQAMVTTQQEAERLALTGASPGELAAHMAQATDQLAQFGPREGFEVAGEVYPPDPTRAGILTADAIASKLGEIGMDARRIMVEADFMRSDAPGQYVEEFRRQVFSGNSPFPAGESLDMLRKMETQARTNESRRRTAAEAEKRRLEKGMDETINAYVSMTEAGVPVAIPKEERARILKSLAPYPELQRQAEIEFQVADAAVATHDMTGPELMAYVEQIRGDMDAAIAEGRLDLGGAAIIESLEDRIKKVQDAVTAETIGLPMIEQLALDGAAADDVDYDALRAQAAGKPDLIKAVNEVEAFHRDTEKLDGMSAAERDRVLEDARGSLASLAAAGMDYGEKALQTTKVIDRLAEWSEHRRTQAASDPVKFARSVGVDLPGFEEAETMDQVGTVIAERVNLLAPHTTPEGVEHPVPLTQAELDQISEVFHESPRGQRAAFLGTIADLGEDQAMEIFKRIGQSEPVIFAAGAVYSMGNQQAAGVILRGAVDTKLDGGTATDLAIARETALAPLLEADMIAPEGIEDLDTTALAYARGLALAEGGRAIEAGDLEKGYMMALGRQQDGTGGMAETSYGTTLLPEGWDHKRINRAIGGITDAKLTQIARGLVVDRHGRAFSAEALERSIEGLRPSPEDPNILVPLDADGNVFLTDDGSERGILTFDLRDLEE